MEEYLIIIGSSILLALGTIHLFYTFFTKRLYPKRNKVVEVLKEECPVLTSETTMWKAWIGFNASHSAGIIFFAKINILIVFNAFELFQESLAILILDNGFILFFLFLAKKYWFRTPFLGVFAASICFLVSTVLIVVHQF